MHFVRQAPKFMFMMTTSRPMQEMKTGCPKLGEEPG